MTSAAMVVWINSSLLSRNGYPLRWMCASYLFNASMKELTGPDGRYSVGKMIEVIRFLFYRFVCRRLKCILSETETRDRSTKIKSS